MFSNKKIEGNTFVNREDGYYRCYYVGTDSYPFPAVSLTKLAGTVGFPKKTVRDYDKDKRAENKKRYTRVGMERLEDLDKLIIMRQDEIRERFHFFRVMGNTLFYLGKEPADVLQYMDERNKRLYEPVSENCLLRIFTFCKEDYEKYLNDPKLGIKYTNKRIVELLQLRPYEQQEMKQLIGEVEAWTRVRFSQRVSSRKAYSSVKQRNQSAREAADDIVRQELWQMRQNGMSNNEIAKKKNFGLRKVDRLIGKDMEKAKAKDDLKQRVKDMTGNGMSVSEISKALGIPTRKVQRIRAQMQ